MVSRVSVARPPPKAGSLPVKSTKPFIRTKRSADDAELDEPTIPDLPDISRPIKKPRVTFNPTIESKVLEEFKPAQTKGRSLESVRAEVRSAITSHLNGESEGYDLIKDAFSARREGRDEAEEEKKGVDMKLYLLALTSHASMLNRGCSGLVKAVFDCEWMGRDEMFVKAYVYFLGSLASSQGAYVGGILKMLVGHFQEGRLTLYHLQIPLANDCAVKISSGRLPGCDDVSRTQMVSRIHVAIKYILRLIPSASAALAPILTTSFPDAGDSKKDHLAYINNLIRLIEYTPELKSDIFALITEKLAKIDVQMQVDLDDLDDEVAAAIVQGLALNPIPHEEKDRAEDGEDSESEEEDIGSDDEGEDLDLETKRAKEIQGNIEKMDAILDLLFTIYTPYFADPHSLEAAQMFGTLLSHFANIVLPTYKSRHTQFLLFHFAQKAEHLIDSFTGTCIQMACDSNRPAVLRQSASAYLASFVARGAHVESHVVRTVFDVIGSELEIIRTAVEGNCRGPDLKRYGTYYAMTQALIYIFCFRWRDLCDSTDILEDDDPLAFVGQALEWMPGMKNVLYANIYSRLNPLKICSPPIVAEFAKIARHLGVMEVAPLIEGNKRIRLTHLSVGEKLRDTGNGGTDEGWHQLDAYFPFDPYQLPLSKKWIEGDYIQWKDIQVPGLNQPEEEDSEEEGEEEDDVEVEEDSATEEDDE